MMKEKTGQVSQHELQRLSCHLSCLYSHIFLAKPYPIPWTVTHERYESRVWFSRSSHLFKFAGHALRRRQQQLDCDGRLERNIRRETSEQQTNICPHFCWREWIVWRESCPDWTSDTRVLFLISSSELSFVKTNGSSFDHQSKGEVRWVQGTLLHSSNNHAYLAEKEERMRKESSFAVVVCSPVSLHSFPFLCNTLSPSSSHR